MIIRRGEKKRKQKNKINRKRPSLGLIIKKFFFWTIFLGFWATALWTIFFSDVMRANQVVVESSRVQKEEVEAIVRDSISKKYLSLIPQDNLLLIPEKKIEQRIKQKFIFIRDVEVTRSFPRSIKVHVEERESHIVWCSNNKCLLVDERAEAFYELGPNDKKLEEQLVQVKDLSGKEVQLEMRVAEPSFIKFCEDLPDRIALFTGIQIENRLETPSSMSEEVRASTVGGWTLMLSTERSVDAQSEILKKVIKDKIPSDKIQQLEYIDLRIKGKATFKFSESEPEEHEDEAKSEEEEDAS